ncbi:hypothetical protein ES703_38946 [subsurface metagenome]
MVDAALGLPEILVLRPDIPAPNVNRLYGGTFPRNGYLELHNRVHAVVIAAARTRPFVSKIKRGGRIGSCFGIAQAGICEQ